MFVAGWKVQAENKSNIPCNSIQNISMTKEQLYHFHLAMFQLHKLCEESDMSAVALYPVFCSAVFPLCQQLGSQDDHPNCDAAFLGSVQL